MENRIKALKRSIMTNIRDNGKPIAPSMLQSILIYMANTIGMTSSGNKSLRFVKQYTAGAWDENPNYEEGDHIPDDIEIYYYTGKANNNLPAFCAISTSELVMSIFDGRELPLYFAFDGWEDYNKEIRATTDGSQYAVARQDIIVSYEEVIKSSGGAMQGNAILQWVGDTHTAQIRLFDSSGENFMLSFLPNGTEPTVQNSLVFGNTGKLLWKGQEIGVGGGSSTLLPHAAQLKTAETLNSFYGKGLQVGTASNGIISDMDQNDCFVMSIGWPTGAYAVQIAIDDGSSRMVMRYCKSGEWSSWVTVYPQSGANGLTPNRIVETNDEGGLSTSDYSVDDLIQVDKAIMETNVPEFEFYILTDTNSGSSSHPIPDKIYLTDVPSEYQGVGQLVHIQTDNVGINYSKYNNNFAYRIQRSGSLDGTSTSYTYYEFYLHFSNDDKGNSYEDYQFDADQTKLFKNKSNGKVYVWSSGKLVEYDKQLCGNKLQLGSINEDKLSDSARAKLNVGSMVPFMGILTDTQMANITVHSYNYIQSPGDNSPMGIFFYKRGTGIGRFVAMSQNDAINSEAGEKGLPAYNYFENCELFNDYSSGTPTAREDQLFLIKRRNSVYGEEATGDDRGVYRYIGTTKSFTKLY